MSAKFTLASNANAGDRLLNVGQCAVQLSTGDLVMLVFDPSQVWPITVQVVTGHTAPSVISAIYSVQLQINSTPQSFAMCRDASDNIYIVAPLVADPTRVATQTFKKGSGLTWTFAGISGSGLAFPFPIHSLAVTWCNTGGGLTGGGQLMVIYNDTASIPYWETQDAGALLAGSTNAGVAAGTNQVFLGAASRGGGNLDIASDGFGTSSGIAIVGTTSNDVRIGSWGVSAGGQLTTGGGLVTVVPAAAITATTRCRVVSYGRNRWAAIYPSVTNAGQLTVQNCASSILLASSVDTGTASNFPAPGATLSWGATPGPPNASQVWIYAWSTATPTTMLRLPITFDHNGQPSVGAVVSDDTGVGSGTNSTIRTVRHGVTDFQHADWQTFNTNGATLSLIGDYSFLPAAPLPATLVAPVNNASVLAQGTYSWTYNPAFTGDMQTAAYFRRQAGSAAFEYWTGTAWQAGEVSVAVGGAVGKLGTSATTTLTFPAGQWTTGSTYSWSVDVTGIAGVRAGYAAPQSIGIAQVSPSTPTLTAAYDATVNVTTLTLHSADATGVNGSIEYSDDGVTWFFVRGGSALTVSPGTATVLDYEMDPGVRQYRARSWTVVPFGYSAYATQSVTAAVTTHRLGDPTSATGWMFVNIYAGTFNTAYHERLAAHTLLGRSKPVVVADAIGGEDGSATVWTHTDAEEASFLALVNSQKTLMLVAPEGLSWYIRVTSDRPVTRPLPGAANRLKEHAIAWVNVDRPGDLVLSVASGFGSGGFGG